MVKGIKTKEPAVMIAALECAQGGRRGCRRRFCRHGHSSHPLEHESGAASQPDAIPGLRGPGQVLIRAGHRRRQTKKLQDLNGNSQGQSALPADDFLSFGAVAGSSLDANGTTEDDFALLVKGKSSGGGGGGFGGVSSNPARFWLGFGEVFNTVGLGPLLPALLRSQPLRHSPGHHLQRLNRPIPGWASSSIPESRRNNRVSGPLLLISASSEF